MNNDDINKKLKELTIEDFIWVIYIGIIFLSWYSNSLERNYYITKNNNSKEKYRHVMLVIFTILLIVYIYFLKGSINGIKNLSKNATKKQKDLAYLSFYASLLITISGVIFLYISYIDNDLDVEVAFN